MNRSLLNLTIDLLAAVCLLVMIATGYILRFPLPPTTNRTHELWEMSRHEWGSVHSWASLVLLAVLLAHVILHWEWLFATIRRRFSINKVPPTQRLIAGISTVMGLLVAGGLFAWAAHSGVREMETPLHSSSETGGPMPIPLEQTRQQLEYPREVMAIFESSCISCHGPKRQRGGLRVDRRADLFAADDAEPWIVPGNARASRLIDIVSGKVKDMRSASEHRLQAEEIAVLVKWINSGAEWPRPTSTIQPIKQP